MPFADKEKEKEYKKKHNSLYYETVTKSKVKKAQLDRLRNKLAQQKCRARKQAKKELKTMEEKTVSSITVHVC